MTSCGVVGIDFAHKRSGVSGASTSLKDTINSELEGGEEAAFRFCLVGWVKNSLGETARSKRFNQRNRRKLEPCEYNFHPSLLLRTNWGEQRPAARLLRTEMLLKIQTYAAKIPTARRDWDFAVSLTNSWWTGARV